MTYRLGVDVGGTFTDVVLYDSDAQRVWLAKTPSTPQDQSVGVIEGIRLAADARERRPSRSRRDPPRHHRRHERRPGAPRSALRPDRDEGIPAHPPPRRGLDAGAAVRVHGVREARAADRHALRPRGARADGRRRGDHRADRRGRRPRRRRGARGGRGRGADRLPAQRPRQRAPRAGRSPRSPRRSRPTCRCRSRPRSCPSSASTSAP